MFLLWPDDLLEKVLLNPITQDEEAIEGLEYITEFLVRCKVTEDAFLTSSATDQRYLPFIIKGS